MFANLRTEGYRTHCSDISAFLQLHNRRKLLRKPHYKCVELLYGCRIPKAVPYKWKKFQNAITRDLHDLQIVLVTEAGWFVDKCCYSVKCPGVSYTISRRRSTWQCHISDHFCGPPQWMVGTDGYRQHV